MSEEYSRPRPVEQHGRSGTRRAAIGLGVASVLGVGLVIAASLSERTSGTMQLEGIVTDKVSNQTFEIAKCAGEVGEAGYLDYDTLKAKPISELPAITKLLQTSDPSCTAIVRTGEKDHCDGPPADFAASVQLGDVVQERRHRDDPDSTFRQYCTWHVIGQMGAAAAK